MAPRLRVALLLLLGVCNGLVVGDDCADDEFQCTESKECISKTWVCDEVADCQDRTDEPPLYDCTGYGEEEEEELPDDGEDEDVDESGGMPPEVQAPAGPTPTPEEPAQKCGLRKCKGGNKFQMMDGQTYKYQYVTQSETRVEGSSPSNTTLTMTATLAINVLTACEMELLVESLRVETSRSDNGRQQETVHDTAFVTAVTKNPLRFAYHDGMVKEVCPAQDEHPHALNFKRAAISLFQNTMKRLDLDHHALETDVVGDCEIDYQVKGVSGKNLLIQRTRDLPTCTTRSSTTSFIQGVPYDFVGGIHTIPLLDSSSICIQEIGQRMIQTASCKEEHRLTPFRSDQGGIVTTVTQNLEFSYRTFSKAKMGRVHQRTSLLYDHHNHIHHEGMQTEADDAHIWRSRANLVLDQIKINMETEGIATNAPKLFLELVQILRHLDFQQLWAISQERSWGPERLVFDDALPMVGTGGSVGVMRDIMGQGHNNILANTWLTSLAFIPRPDLDTINEAAPLLEFEQVHADAFLGVGALVHTYCRDHPDCHDHQPVRRVMDALHHYVTSSCRRDTSEKKIQVLMALKGIGNAGLAVTEGIPDSLAQCFFEQNNENEIRLGAVTAFRRVPCKVSRGPLKTLFLDPKQDSELRIAAYLELMRCPDYQIFNMVKEVLLHEEVNQVGSFVFTHLENLKETGMPSRAELQGLLSNQEISSKFTPDVRKFSRNIELSGFYDQLNVGGNMDANVVFSQQSYIPRSTTFNFTTDLFGHSLNLLEVGARVEGWDHHLESMFFGQPTSAFGPIINNPKIRELITTSGRGREYFEKAAELSLHMKTFGNEIYYRHLHGLEEVLRAFNTLNPAERIRQLNEGNDINLQKSWLAAESAYIIPTTAGLPLNLSVTASIALDVHASGNIDLLDIFQTGRAGIRGRLKPSVGVEVVGSMMVDGHAAQSGAELVSTLHSSTVVEGRFEVGGSEFIRIDFGMPRDEVDIMNITTNLVLVHGSNDANAQHSREAVQGVTNDRMEVVGCSGYEQDIGSKLCWNVQYPNASRVPESPFYPLTGPSQLQLVLLKTDPTLTSYQIRYTWERRPEYRTFLLSVNTPGTATPREHSIRYNINFRSQNINLDLQSPQTTISATGRYVLAERERRADVSVALNGQEVATLTAGLSAHSKQGRAVITPIFTVTYRGQDVIKVSGVVDRREKQDAHVFKLDMQVKGLVPVGETGRWEVANGTIEGELSVKENEWGGQLDAFYTTSVSSGEERVRIEYDWSKSLSPTSDIKTELNVKFFSSQFPNINFKGQLHRWVHYGSRRNSIQLNFGENFEDDSYRVDLYEGITYYSSEMSTTFNFTASIKQPRRNLDLKFGVDWFHDNYVANTGFLIQYATNQRVESRLHLTKEPTGLMDVEGQLFFKVTDGVDWEVKGHIREDRGKIYSFDGSLRSGQHWLVEVTGAYADLSTRLEHLHNLLLELRLPSYGLTKINATFQADGHRISLDTHVLTNAGHMYRVVLAYESDTDQLQTETHKLQLEVHMPNQLYAINAALNIGTVITLTSDIHLDRLRDIHMSITADILQANQRGLQVLIKWDANRDPNQKLMIEATYATPSENETIFTLQGLLYFLGQHYRTNWMTHRRFEYVDRDMIWENKNDGSFSWTQADGSRQEIKGNVTMRLRRGDTAELYCMFDVGTPFPHWRDNYLEVKYFRNPDEIEGKLTARWHEDEFLDLQLLAQKHFEDNNYRIESKLDVRSSFEGLISATTGVLLEKKPGIVDTNFYIQWDTDRLEVTLEGKDNSFGEEGRYSLFGQILTTMEGYREMSSAVDFIYGPESTNIQATTKWEGHFYKMKFHGNVYNGMEYLKAVLTVDSVYEDRQLVTTSLRVYHEPTTMEEKLLIIVKWPMNEEVRVEGQVATLPHHFKAGIHVDTTMKDILDRAIIVIGHSKDRVMKTEARIQWNDQVDAGFELLGQVESLTDFFISCTILTPFPGYETIKGEIRNLFQLHPEVKVHPRIFGQLGERKYGLGARYEQGQLPRLRVAVELYTPLPELHTIFLDICDNSTMSEVSYDLTMKYGPTKHLRINVELEKKEGGVDGHAIAELPLQSLGENLEDATLEAVGSYFWQSGTTLNLILSSQTSSFTKVEVLGKFARKEKGNLQLSIITPVAGYESLDLNLEYQLPYDDLEGHFECQVNTADGREFQLITTGTTKNIQGSFSSPYDPFRSGSFMWQLTAIDILKSHMLAKLSWQEGDLVFDASVKFQRNYIQMLEGTLSTPWDDLGDTTISLLGQPQEGGYRNQLVLTSSSRTYKGDLFWKFQDDYDWQVNVQIVPDDDGTQGSYTLQLGLTNVERQPFKFSFHIATPHTGFHNFKFDLMLDQARSPYHLKIDCVTFMGAGNLEATFTSLAFSKVEGDISLTLKDEEEARGTTYMLQIDLTNDSAPDMIDVEGELEFKSNDEYWDQLILRGKVRQVTRDPGELTLYLLWPRLDPFTFKATAEHHINTDQQLLIIKPTMSLDLTRAKYGFSGEFRREGQQLNLTGILDWERESSGPQQVVLRSSLVFNRGAVDGHLTFDLPMVEGWHSNKADIHYETREGRHWFRSTIETGSDVTTISGNMQGEGFPAADGSITFTSALKWESQPLTLNFKQDLTNEGYEGTYHLEWPTWNATSSAWMRSPVHASLKHHFLEAGHRGNFQITTRHTKNKPIIINYGFKFPVTGDVTVELGVLYAQFTLKVKTDRVTVVLGPGRIRQRTSLEFHNILWPFGISYTKTTNRKSNTEVETVRTLELFDLDITTRRITLDFTRNTAQSGRHSVIKVNALDREIILDVGYDLTPDNFHTKFLLSWASDSNIELDINWQDISRGFDKEHVLKGKFSQPFRTMLLDGYYKRSARNLTALIKFNWDTDNQSGEEEAVGKLQWTNVGTMDHLHHKAFVNFVHPMLEKDLRIGGELRQNHQEFLALEGVFQYSPDPQKDLNIQMLVTADENPEHPDTVVVEERAGLTHGATNFTVQTNGTLTLNKKKCELVQNFIYIHSDGHHSTANVATIFNLIEKTLQFSVETMKKKLVDLMVEVQENMHGGWSVAAGNHPGQDSPLLTYLEVHPTHNVITITLDNLLSNDSNDITTTSYDTSYPRYIAEQIVIEGGMEDQRHARLNIRHLQPAWMSDVTEEELKVAEWVEDVSFFFRLNNSRLLTSQLAWRPEIKYEMMSEMGELLGSSYGLRQSVEEWLRVTVEAAGHEALDRAGPIFSDFLQHVKPIVHHSRNESGEFVADMWKLYNSMNSTAVELNVQESVQFILTTIMQSLEEIPAYQRIKAKIASREGGGRMGQIVQKIQGFLKELLSDVRGQGFKEKLRELFTLFTQTYDQFAKQLYLRARAAVQGFTNRLGEWFTNKWRAVYNNYKPHILRTFDSVETNAWNLAKKIIGWLERLGLEIKTSAHYLRLQQLGAYLEGIYRDFSEKSNRENMEKYYSILLEKLKSGIQMALAKVAPFVEDWVGELKKAWQTLMQAHIAQRVRGVVVAAYNKFVWMVRYVDISGHVMDMTAFLLEHGWTIFSQTGVQASQKYILEKTSFKFSPEKGQVELVQKLPLDWHTFAHRPSWHGLPEYQKLARVRDIFTDPDTTSGYSFWHKMIKLHFNPSQFIPPFHATGYMIGEQHFMTFDGRPLEFKGRCQHLLVADMIGGMWAVAVNYHSHSSRTIVVYVHNSTIELAKDFRVKVDGQTTELPVKVASAHVHRGLHKLHVDTHHSFHITWNLAQDVVSITIHGSYFGKTGGLLGLYNYEPYDDFILPNSSTTDVVSVLANEWIVSPRECESIGNIARPPAMTPIPPCTRLFSSKSSPLKGCFYDVDAEPYLEMCKVDYRHGQKDTCTAATAYMEACMTNGIPIKIPEFCVQCQYETNDGQTKTLDEGSLVLLEMEDIPKSTDIVILVEAQQCNHFLTDDKPLNRFSHFITVMNEELEASGLHSVRYALVAYGGDGPFATPVVATVNNQIFTDASHIHLALQHITFAAEEYEEYGYQSYDAFLAFAFAARLHYRAGVSITFVHFPCHSCQPIIPSMEYSTMFHILLEYSVTLHVFNPEPFALSKRKEQNKLLGIDTLKAYTVKDATRRLNGDEALRRQVPTPKDNLMYCAPLALETNGTIFTSVRLSDQRRRSVSRTKKNIKKLASVFGKRVAITAIPTQRKRCVCTPSSPDGAATIECDNWGSGHLSILEEYGYNTNFNFSHETNSEEEGLCVRRNTQGECIEWPED
ncbi:hypothetical protein Pcinc_014366 [Petrolisthes cinctipes]|uniref:Vitellogenin n=1 Tax=Petrolisthes cinctipes TaxID=88211 RepID=A0AAE1KPA4_PETCI|nr:hypothetical protein Pcinc_014366 [Petrolisthes cinctipes]